MTIDCKDLISLPVYTRGGLLLGKVKSFEIESETQTILQYAIKSRNLIGSLLTKRDRELIIHRNQVISISKDKMIVEDNVVKEEVLLKLKQSVSQDAPVLSNRLSIQKRC